MSAEDTRPDYGHSIVFGHTIRYVSASSISAFDPNQEGGCHRRYWFEKIDGKKPPEKTWQNTGKKEHKSLEHYFKTGENILGPVVRHGMRFIPEPGNDLIVEEGFGDYKAALAARDRMLAGVGTKEEVERHGLAFFGIPLMGAMDLRHRRGVWLDDKGSRNQDPPGTAEINDWKTSGDVKKWAKTEEGLVMTVQMPVYARATLHVWPDLRFVRISHGYFGTKKRESKKVSRLLDLDTIYRRGEDIQCTVAAMVDVAKETDHRKIEPNIRACGDFRGCPHQPYCERPQASLSTLLQIGGAQMASLFDMMKQPTQTNGAMPLPSVPSTTAPTAPSAVDPIAIARQKIAAGMMRFDPSGIVFDREGADSGWVQRPPTQFELVAFATPAAPVAPPHIGAINPPDSPPFDPVAAAAPLPAEVIANIEDPEIKVRAEAHALASAQQQAAEAAANPEAAKTGGRCLTGGTEISVTPKEATSRKKSCPSCGKEFRLKDGDFNIDFTGIIVPRHNLPKVDAPPAPKPPAATNPANGVPGIPGSAPAAHNHSMAPIVSSAVPPSPLLPEALAFSVDYVGRNTSRSIVFHVDVVALSRMTPTEVQAVMQTLSMVKR
ncbi:MAG: hypothetical protein UY96_C0003G0092 [Parcubacteria group bacterium GW2011_GWB1_56_8]|nr:MAG: hypothetical protein UY96_C0003G0092 [Parcubacteria group bacterium GW2011_GWB1_56_8]